MEKATIDELINDANDYKNHYNELVHEETCIQHELSEHEKRLGNIKRLKSEIEIKHKAILEVLLNQAGIRIERIGNLQ